MPLVKTGLEIFCNAPFKKISKTERIGLLCNPASVDSDLNHAGKLFSETLSEQLTALFSPQHGFFSEKQDNMIESDNITDPTTGLPVFSLYGETRIPTKEMFDHIDTLVVDLQDVGTRVYTFIYTLSYCLESAKKYNKKVIVLDRPNPVNGIKVEGNCLKPELTSFVGRFPIPMRHGLTIGEIARLFNDHFDIGCNLEVISMSGWKREMAFTDISLPWVLPSPNLPTPSSALVYPGQVILEGTNISEGRGTTLPFEQFGAPFIDQDSVLNEINPESLDGITLRKTVFEPTSNKWAGQPCFGFQIHINDYSRYRSYKLSLEFLNIIYRLYKNEFQWKQPPYEYELEKLPIDLITGDAAVRECMVI